MADMFSFIDFPGVIGPKQVSYTLTQGISPSYATLECDLETAVTLQRTGDLKIGDGVTAIILPKCIVEKVPARATISGRTITLTIADRRWMWAYGSISGSYNIPVPRVHDIQPIAVDEEGDAGQGGNAVEPDDVDTEPAYQEGTKKHAKDLAKLCLKAMKHKKYDVAIVPEDDFPETHWDATNPAQALQSLVEKYGMRVTWRPSDDFVIIVKQGIGEPIPEALPGDLAEDALTIDPPEPPAKIAVYGAPKRYQLRFALEAVGLDLDGKVRLIDNLSYKPRGGWKKFGEEPPFDFDDETEYDGDLPEGYSHADVTAAANLSVYKWYRIKHTLPIHKEDEFWIPPDKTDDKANKKRRDHIILLPNRVETAIDTLGQRNLLPATCYGKTSTGSISFDETEEGDEVKAAFTVDPERQLIRFNDFQYQYVNRNGGKKGKRDRIAPAELILETACHILDNDSHHVIRFRKDYPIDFERVGERPEDDEMPIIREDIRYYQRIDYIDAIENKFNLREHNQEACEKQAKFYAESEAVRYLTTTPQQRTYNSVRAIWVDGAIENVNWSVGLNGIRTTASRGTELPVLALKYPIRRKAEEASIEYGRRMKEQTERINEIRKRQGSDFDPFGVR